MTMIPQNASKTRDSTTIVVLEKDRGHADLITNLPSSKIGVLERHIITIVRQNHLQLITFLKNVCTRIAVPLENLAEIKVKNQLQIYIASMVSPKREPRSIA